MDDGQSKLQLAPPAARFGKRHVQASIMALSTFLIYALRINLSVAIVPMTGQGLPGAVHTDGANNTGGTNFGDSFNLTEGYQHNESTPVIPHEYPVYNWDEKIQGLVLSSFFWGYLLTQVPAGILTQRYGGHRLLSWALITTSILTTLLPPCAYLGGWWLVCVNRMLQGVTQGFVYPSIYTLMGLWVPPLERVTLTAIILSAQNLGPVGATPLAGFLAAYSGWPSIFYCFGAGGFAAALVVYFLGSDSPASHRSISEEERKYIEKSLGGAKEQMPIPWRSIMTSRPAWAVFLSTTFLGGVFLTFLTKIPTYLNNILKFNIKDNGLISALPYLACWCFAYLFSFTCNFGLDRGWLTMNQSRKVYNSIGHVGPAIAMVALGYSTNTTVCVVLLTLSVGLMSATYQGVQSSSMDLAPNFSGTIFSVSNLLSSIAGICGPIIVGLIVTESGSVYQWRIVYFVLAGAMLFGNLMFVMFSSAEVQPWNSPKRRKSQISLKEYEALKV